MNRPQLNMSRGGTLPPAQPEEETQPPFAPRVTISTTVSYRGRSLIITSEGYSADQFCDMLDRRFPLGTPQAAAPAPTTTGATPPLCPVHKRLMKPMRYPGKRGEQWMCTAKIGDDVFCEHRA